MIPVGIRKYFPSAPGLTGTPKTALIKYCLVLLLFVIGALHLRSAFFFHISQNLNPSVASFSNSITHPEALVIIARDDYLKKRDLTSALVLYKQAIKNFVPYPASWLGIAEVLKDQGKTGGAKDALTFIHSNFKDNQDITWAKVKLASTLDHKKILHQSLFWLAKNFPQRKKEIFALANQTWSEPNILMNKFGRDFYLDILREYIENDEFKKSLTVWNQIVTEKAIKQDTAFQYVDYLVGQRAPLLAAQIWSETVGEDSPSLYNGDFEQAITHSGFDWRIPDDKGYTWKKGDYGTGLEITFDGKENVAFQLSQILPITPGKYVFSGTVETDGLTTDQLPFWLIQGVQCSGLNTQSEMVLPYQHVSEFIVTFTVPASCELIRISLVRRPSSHHNNKISGKITVNKLAVRSEDNVVGDFTKRRKNKEERATGITIGNLQIQQ